MAVYRSSKCPYCKYQLEFMERTGWNDFGRDIGHPFQNCPNCQKPYKTGMDYWDNLTNSKKSTIYLKVGVTIFVRTVYYYATLCICILFLDIILKSEKYLKISSFVKNFLEILLGNSNYFLLAAIISVFLVIAYRTTINHFNLLKNISN